MSHSKRLDLDQIATAAHVSPLAVWQMIFGSKENLHAEEITRIQAVLDALEYVTVLPPHRADDRGAIVVVVPSGQRSAREDFAGHVLQAFTAEAQQHDFSLTLYHQWTDIVPDVRSHFQPFDYVVMIAAEKTLPLIDACESLGRPYVLIETEYQDTRPLGVTINTDNHAAIQAALAHLFALSHRRIGFITGRRQNRSSQERLAAYKAVLEVLGVPPDDTLIRPGTWLEPSGYDGAQALLALADPPTAIVAANDTMALGVMRAARTAGLTLGKDLSLVGFDDVALAARVAPPLTTLRQRMAVMGRLAFGQVQAFAQGQPPNGHAILLPADLIVRGSTGPPLR